VRVPLAVSEAGPGGVDANEPAKSSQKLDPGTPGVQSEIRFAELLADAEGDGVQSVGTTVISSPAKAQSQGATEHVRGAPQDSAPQDSAPQEGTTSSSSRSSPDTVASQTDGDIDDPVSSAQALGEADRRDDDTLSESDKRLVMQWVGKGLEELRRGRTFSGMEDEELQADTSFKAAVRTPGLPPCLEVRPVCRQRGRFLERQST